MKNFNFWIKYLTWASVFFAVQGIFWAVWGSFDPIGWYDGLVAKSLFQTSVLPEAAEKITSFLLVPFGATEAGYFILFYFIVKYPLANRELWAYKALWTAVLTWFLLDSGLCLWHKAYFNIIVVNIPAILLLGIPLWLIRGAFEKK